MPETSSHYPSGAQAADTNISREIAGLRSVVEVGFSRIDAQIEHMVRKDTHRAEIERLQQAIDFTDQRLTGEMQSLRDHIQRNFEELASRDERRDEQLRQREALRDAKYSRRVGWTITAVGVGVSFVSLLLRFFPL